MRKALLAGVCGGWLAVTSGCGVLAAQDEVRGPDGTMRVLVPGVEVLAVPGKPFSAATTTVWTRTLPDGSTITKRLNATMARDSSGRVYRERHHFAPDDTRPAPLYETTVVDPTRGAETTCTLATHHCVVRNFHARTTFRTAPAGPFPDGKGALARESLGQDTMQGLAVTGTRETTTTYPGMAGNSSALVATREFWYAPDLEINLAVTRKDAAMGEQVIRLNSVSRSEPEAAQFAPPAGFLVEDQRRPQALDAVTQRGGTGVR